MSAKEKNKNEMLSRIVADLFAGSKGGEDLSSRIQRLREEIKKAVESEDTVFGKFRELVESFREIIPEEKQRYTAAIKALSTTSKLTRQEIVKAVNTQLEELKILEKGFLPAGPGWRDEMKTLEARSKEMKDEISKLREKIGRLESEEKGILSDLAAKKREMEHVEKAVNGLFADIGAEITAIKRKVEEFTSEAAAPPPVPPKASSEKATPPPSPPKASGKSDIPGEKKTGGEQKEEIRGSSAPKDTEWHKKCPMCGGRMDLYSEDEKWICYSCAHEEPVVSGAQGDSEEQREFTNAPKIISASEPVFDPPPGAESQGSYTGSSPTKKKTCPACGKKMHWYETEKAWRCSFCEYERRI